MSGSAHAMAVTEQEGTLMSARRKQRATKPESGENAPREGGAIRGVVDAITARLAGWASFWIIASILAHIVLIGAVVYYTPLREWFFAEPDPDTITDIEGSRIARAAEELLRINTEDLRDAVARQQEALDRIDQVTERRHDRLVRQVSRLRDEGRDLPDVEPLGEVSDDEAELDYRLGDKDFLELYDLARQLDRATYAAYRRLRAVELSRIQELPLTEAHEVTDLAVPDRLEIEADIFRARITRARPPQLPAIERLKQLGSEHEVSVPSLGELKQQFRAEDGRLPELEEVLEAIREAGGEPPSLARIEDEVADALRPNVEQLTGEIHKARGEVSMMLADARRMLDLAEGIATDSPAVTLVGGGGAVAETAGDGDGWGSPYGPPLEPRDLFPGARETEIDPDAFDPPPARKLKQGGIATDFAFIDSWYIIGPFPNPDRDHIDTPFPPESVIDLDEVYVGRDGRELRWRYRQSNNLLIVPHDVTTYAIWYLFTEVYVDEAQTRLALVGSDDYSRIWVNGEQQFETELQPHHWIPDRDVAELEFRPGYNQVLVKLENAGGTTGFSLALFLEDISP